MNVPPYYQPQYSADLTAENASFPMIGGILTLVGGIIGILAGLLYIILYLAVLSNSMGMFDSMMALIFIYGSIGIVFGPIGVIGGFFALRKKSWTIPLIGAICAMISGLFTVIPLILGILGLIFVALSKNQFQT